MLGIVRGRGSGTEEVRLRYWVTLDFSFEAQLPVPAVWIHNRERKEWSPVIAKWMAMPFTEVRAGGHRLTWKRRNLCLLLNGISFFPLLPFSSWGLPMFPTLALNSRPSSFFSLPSGGIVALYPRLDS